MSSFSSSSPPLTSTCKNTSAFASTAADNHLSSPSDAPSSSPPLQSSSPLRTPSRLTPCCSHTEWPSSGYFYESDTGSHEQQDIVELTAHPRLCDAYPKPPLPSKCRPLPSLITKFATQTRGADTALSYSPSPFSSICQTPYFNPQRSGAATDDCEEYDLESMDIHIHETYFATSAERGRWLSSPIAPRVWSRATPPMRGYSSPVKRPADASPLKEHSPKRPRFCSVDEQISISLPKGHDKNSRCSLSLPPSSPPLSPMSNLSFLGDDYENDSVVDPLSNPESCHSHAGTPELSLFATTSTEPAESVHVQTPHEIPTIVHPTHSPFRSPGSVTSRQAGRLCRHSSSPRPDDILSPLSQFELDLVEEEYSKLPFSDTVNKPHPGQNSGMIVHAVSSPVQSLLTNPNDELDASLSAFGGLYSNKKVKKRGSTIRNPRTRQTKKRIVNKSGADAKEGRRKGNHVSHQKEPDLSERKLLLGAESHGGKSFSRRSRVSEIERAPLHPATEEAVLESAHLCDKKAVKPMNHCQSQQAALALVVGDTEDAEFHSSLTGMLIEAFATSRATSMDSSALCSVLTQAHPQLTRERSKEELLIAIAAVLEAGRVRCGMFDKVDSSGEKSRHKALENRWFYVPERDEDQERASLISAIMPRKKRNETKKYKQYYYRPLDKICRWDPEDAP